MSAAYNLDAAIRKVPDFPRPGVLFYDITGILADTGAFTYCIDEMVSRYESASLDAVVAIESRGFLFAAPFALRLGLPLVLARKKGKLPGETVSRTFQLEYGQDTLEIKRVDLQEKRRMLIVDDLIATGGTIEAAAEIIAGEGSTVAGVFCVIGLPFLNYRRLLGNTPVTTLIDYNGE
ncbi:MAG TPA: adenine phosphoribosyltransferase [Spirochaetia bacterium]|nr:adenine phosphoribosyltransferase [Spirochaetia bacterium]